MTSNEHHYGVVRGVSSTPIWSMGEIHHFGAMKCMDSTNNIERFRKARRLSRPKLANKMDTSPQQVERLEKGQRKLTVDWLNKAAVALGVSPADIITPDARPDLQEPAVRDRIDIRVDRVPVLNKSPDAPPTQLLHASDDLVEVPVVDLRFSMGPGTTLDDYIEETSMRFSLDYIRSFTRTAPHLLRIGQGVGDSMFPTLMDSDAVWMDVTQRTLNLNDRIWAISLFGAAAIKRLRPIGKGRILVISDNPAVADQEVDEEDLFIAGRVIRFERDV